MKISNPTLRQNPVLEPTELVQLTYVSHRSIGLDDEAVVDLAISANRANRILEVTGCLWFGAKRFFQVLEGRHDVVDALYRRIQADVRHTEVRLLSYGTLPARRFGRWNLAHVARNEDQTLDQLIHDYAGISRRTPPEAREMTLLQRIIDRLCDVVGERSGPTV